MALSLDKLRNSRFTKTTGSSILGAVVASATLLILTIGWAVISPTQVELGIRNSWLLGTVFVGIPYAAGAMAVGVHSLRRPRYAPLLFTVFGILVVPFSFLSPDVLKPHFGLEAWALELCIWGGVAGLCSCLVVAVATHLLGNRPARPA
jgi:hypothetical protein